MEKQDRPYITIYERRAFKSDYDKALILSKAYPASFKRAQKLLVATDNFINRRGWLSNDGKRLIVVTKKSAEFLLALKLENYQPEGTEVYGNRYAAIKFLDSFSSVFPNWQTEYKELNELIWNYF